MRKEAIVSWFQILNLPGGTKQNHETPQSRYTVSGPRFESGTFETGSGEAIQLFATFGNKHSDTAVNKWKVKQWSTVDESKHKIRETSMKLRSKRGIARKKKKIRGMGEELTHVHTLTPGNCHSGSHDNLTPFPVLWIIHGVLVTCDVTCSQATYQASVDCKDYHQ